jgi:hypothetical protein
MDPQVYHHLHRFSALLLNEMIGIKVLFEGKVPGDQGSRFDLPPEIRATASW